MWSFGSAKILAYLILEDQQRVDLVHLVGAR